MGFKLQIESGFFGGQDGTLLIQILVHGEVWFSSEPLELPPQGWLAPTTIVLRRPSP